MGVRASRLTAGAVGAFFILLASAIPSASAAGYTVWSCRGPDGAPISTVAWRAIDNGPATQDSCVSGGSLSARIHHADSLPGRVRGYDFVVPAGARLAGYRIYLHAVTAKANNLDVFQAGIDDAAPAGEVDVGCKVASCTFGVLDAPLAAANLVAAQGIDISRLSLAAVCDRPRGCFDASDDKTLAQARIFRSEVDVRDDVAPVVRGVGGLPASGPLTSPNPILNVGASDEGGGVASLAILIDGNELASESAGGSCQQPYVSAAPCPAQSNTSFALDASTLAPGPHTASVRAVDAAGNTATSAPVAFSVAAGAVLSATPVTVIERVVQVVLAAVPQRVRIAVARDRLTLPDKRGVTGVVRDEAGKPVPGAKVIVRSRSFGVLRARARQERTVTTDGAGRFTIPAGTKSRLLILDVNDSAHRAADQVELKLMARLVLGAQTLDRDLRNGSTLKLRASLTGVGGGAGGKVVLVQAFIDKRWSTVDSLTADGKGEAIWLYRFRATTRRIAYQFRVKVERAGDVWPWPTTVSRAVKVEVSP